MKPLRILSTSLLLSFLICVPSAVAQSWDFRSLSKQSQTPRVVSEQRLSSSNKSFFRSGFRFVKSWRTRLGGMRPTLAWVRILGVTKNMHRRHQAQVMRSGDRIYLWGWYLHSVQADGLQAHRYGEAMLRFPDGSLVPGVGQRFFRAIELDHGFSDPLVVQPGVRPGVVGAVGSEWILSARIPATSTSGQIDLVYPNFRWTVRFGRWVRVPHGVRQVIASTRIQIVP